MGNDSSRREFLRLASLGMAMSTCASGALASDSKLFGVPLPKQVLDFIPRKPLNYIQFAEAVVELENEADHRGLPGSPLEIGKAQSLVDLAEALYQFAMPRLVALIDRSEPIDPDFADRAGELLAELHQSQHELPEALTSGQLGLGRLLTPMRRERYLVEPEPAQGGIIYVPGAPPASAAQMPATSSDGNDEAEEVEVPISRSRDFTALKPEYARLFRKLVVRPQYQESVDWHLALIRKSRARYEKVEAQTGVPWHFVAVTHGLEASFNFRAHFHNGDFPLTARTRQVPAGRPTRWLPPSDWESSAQDALRLLGYTNQSDWTLERTLFRLEAYNGLGYRLLGVPTPYLWSFSNHYERGKFVSDGKFNASARSQQCGAAVLLKLLADAGDIRLESAA